MEIVIPVIVLLVVAIGLYILIKDQINNNSNKTQEQMELQLNSFVESFKLTSAENMAKQLKESKDDKDKMTETLTKLTRELEKIKGTNDQVLTFANQMKTLEKILGNQKQRGILGEIQLENLLANVLPPELFDMQYSFSNNEIVDAGIKVGEYIIPIDAKFSLDNYNKMIDSTSKDE